MRVKLFASKNCFKGFFPRFSRIVKISEGSSCNSSNGDSLRLGISIFKLTKTFLKVSSTISSPFGLTFITQKGILLQFTKERKGL